MKSSADRQRFPDWQVKLWGDTYDKPYVASMRSKIKTYGQRKQVFLCGTIKDMDAVWKETDIFAFPSHHEGFGLALVEAMCCGIPAVGYRSCPAVNEIIVSGENGLLCEDGVEPLADALGRLMDDHMLRQTYGETARSMAEKYHAEKVWKQWEELLCRLLCIRYGKGCVL
jgi:glycosyltransferase involved in cell wall biosynthesis